MKKSAMIRARIEEKLKEDVGKVFDKLGLTTTEAITLFYKQIKLHKGLPFDVRIPNKLTRKVIKDSEKGIDVFEAKDANDLFKQLEI